MVLVGACFDDLTVQIIPGIGHRRANRVGRVRRRRAARVGGTHGAMILVGAWFDDLTVQIIPSIGHRRANRVGRV